MRLAVIVTGAICGSLSLTAVQAAQEPAAQGAAAHAPAAATPPRSGNGDTQAAIQRYRLAIQKELSEQGPYGRRVGEELLGLGTAYAVAGDHHKAVSALTRAMYITRINDGLNTPVQLPILEAIIGQNRALHDWEALDKNYDYLYWVNRRNYGDHDAKLLPVMERVAHWKLKAYAAQAGKSPQQFLQDASRIFADAVTIAEKSYGPTDPNVIDPLYGVAISNFELSSFYASQDLQERYRMSTGFETYPGEEAQRAYDAERDRQMAMLLSYSKGVDAIHQLLEVYKNNPNIPPAAHAAALAHAGDWYLVENRPDDAMTAYGQAYALLRDSGASADAIQQMFGRPHPLTADGLTSPLPGSRVPDLAQKDKMADKPAGTLTAYVLTSLDISDRGRPYNIHVVESIPPGDNSVRRRARDYVSSMVFRPRMENGRTVETDNFKFHIQFND